MGLPTPGDLSGMLQTVPAMFDE